MAAEQTMEEALNLEQELLPCVICGRTFLPIPLAKHTRVCERNATRKRKVFDSLKQRVEGTDLAPFHQRSFLKKGESATPKIEVKQSKWKEKHLELVNAIRAAKGGTSISMPSTLSKRSSTTLGTPTHERCPSCDRQFGPKAFDRHVEWCKDKKTTIHKSPASVLLAKERLEARTKYKVPPLTKSKRALTREKYSPQISTFGSGRTSDVVVNMKSVSACTLDRSPSVRKSKNHLLHPKKSVDRMADGTEPVSEKIVREKVEKGVGDASAKMVQSDRNLNREVKKAIEPMKSSGKRLIFSKINTISVNDDVSGLTVSSLSLGESDSKKLVTWKDTIKSSKSDNSQLIANDKGKVVEIASVRKSDGKDVQLETFSNIAIQSKSKKVENCTFKVVVKEKKSEEIGGGAVRKKQPEVGAGKKIKSPDKKVKGNRPVSSKKETNRSPVFRQIRNPNPKKRLPAGTNLRKQRPPDEDPITDDKNSDGFILDQENEEILAKQIDLSSLKIEDLDDQVFLDEHTEDVMMVIPDHLDGEEEEQIKAEDMVFTNRGDVILYDEEFKDVNVYDTPYYKSQVLTLKTQLTALQDNLFMNWRDGFIEGEVCAERGSKKSSARSGKSAKSPPRSLKGSRRGSPSKIEKPRIPSTDKKIVRSSSDATLNTKPSPRSRIPVSKQIKSPKSLGTTPRLRPERMTSPRTLSARSKDDSPILTKRSDRSKDEDRIKTSRGSSERKLSLRKHSKSKKASRKMTSSSGGDSPERNWKKIHSANDSPRTNLEGNVANEDNIVTQYQWCKSLSRDKKLEKVNSGDLGVSCLTRYRRESKIANCERFLERNRLIAMDLKAAISSTEDTDTGNASETLAKDVCCQTSSVEGLAKTTVDKGDLEAGTKDQAVGNDEDIGKIEENRDGKCTGKKTESYFDSLDEGSVNSNDFKEIDEVLSIIERRKTSVIPTNDGLKTKTSKSNMLFQRSGEDCFSEDSVVDGCESYHSHALSVARIERSLRKCSSDVCLRRNSETSLFASYTEIDLRKFSSYECTSIHGRAEDANLTSDEILEIAGEQFLQSLKNSSQIKTSTPISQKKARSPNISDCVPLKRRKLQHLDDDIKDKRVVVTKDEEEQTCMANTMVVKKVCVDELRKNIEQIKEKKKELCDWEGSANKSTKHLRTNSSIEDDVVSQVEVDTASSVSVEMRRILSTIEEASSNTSSGVNNKILSNEVKDEAIEEVEEGVANAEEGGRKEANLIDLSDDGAQVANGYRFVTNPNEILVPVKVSDSPRKRSIRLKKRAKNQSKYTLTDVATKRRPDSAEFAPNLTPRFLHLIRTIIHPQGAPTTQGSYSDAEEEFLKISRAHCRKLLQLDKHKLNHILESEPLKLPKITTVSTVRGAPKAPIKIIKLPPLGCPSDSSTDITTTTTRKSGVSVASRKTGKILPLLGSDFCKSSVSTRSGAKANAYNSEPDLLDSSYVVMGVRYKLSPRPNSRANTTHNNNNNNKHHQNDNSIDYDPFVSAELQLQELLECDELKTTTTTSTPVPPPPTVQNTPRPHTTPTSKTNTIVNKSPLRKKKPVKSADPKLKKKESRSKGDIAPKRASVIDPPADFCDQLNMLNENFERIENLFNYNDDGEEFGLSKGFYEKFENCSFSLDGILNRRKYSDDLSTIDPCLINENDNLSIPDGLNTDDSSPTSTVDNNYYKLGNRYEEIDHFSENFDSKMSSIEPDGTEIKLKQSISMFDDERFFESGNIDEFVIALSESSVDSKINRKKSSDKNLSKPRKPGRASKLPKSTDKSIVSDSSSFGYAANSATDRKKNNLASLKRSMSLLDPVQKPKTLKNKQDVQNYFNEQELKSPVKTQRSPVKTERSPVKTERSPVKTEKVPIVVTKEETPTPTKLPDDNLFVPKAEELFSVDDEMYEEYKKYEEMYLKEKEEQLKKEERRISDGQSGLLTASEDDESHQQSVKLSGDSAYGRKTPKVRARSTKLTPLDSQRNLAESPNSSSSESSPVIPVTSSTKTTPKMSKFCHECGNRYPLATAKFCVECGVKRLVL